jgi:hypothetical protein
MTPSYAPVADCPAGSTSWDIHVDIAPFDVSEVLTDWADWPLDRGTDFRFDFICLPIQSASDLVYRTFEFPISPTPGYVDGSIYLIDAHNFADLTTLAFGSIKDGAIDAWFSVAVDFEGEDTGFKNRRFEFHARVELPPQLLGIS